MYWIVETEEQLEQLKQTKIEEAFVEIITYHDNLHPALNGISLVYLKPFNSDKGYMLCVDHSETFRVNKTNIDAILRNIKTIWVRDKKSVLYHFQIKTLHDLSLLSPTYIPCDTKAHTYFYTHHANHPKINKIIPISKHYEKCEHIYTQIRNIIPDELPHYFDFYNNKVILAFFGIEKNGIKINKYELDKHYELNSEFYSIKDDRIYTHYNLATTTHRPSNAFNGINFAALKKDDGSRKSFIPNGIFMEFDISAYHPNLVCRLINYDFHTGDIHSAFAELYGTSYQEAKEITFQQLYGGVFKEYEHLEFFQKVKTFVSNNWETFNSLGKITVPISGYCFEKNKLDNMNPQKLFNYILQNVESAVNSFILMDIHKLLKGKKTKIVLYTYDSFLFDIDVGEEGIEEDVKKIFDKYKLTTKIKKGQSYDFTK